MGEGKISDPEWAYIREVIGDTREVVSMVESCDRAAALEMLADAVGVLLRCGDGADALSVALAIDAMCRGLSRRVADSMRMHLVLDEMGEDTEDFLAGIEIGPECVMPNLDPSLN